MKNYKNLFLLASVILIFVCLFFCFLVSESSSDLWNHSYSGSGAETAKALVSTLDGGYLIAAETLPHGVGHYDCWLIKTDAMGNVEWNRTYGGEEESDHVETLLVASDGGYILSGSSSFVGVGDDLFGVRDDFWIMKIDTLGNIQWTQTFKDSSLVGNEIDMIATSDGGYALCGTAEHDFWFAKIDSQGNIKWSETYGGGEHESPSSLIQTPDGGYLLAGYVYSLGTGSNDFRVIKIDQYGQMEWNQTYGGPNRETAGSLIETSDGGYIITGYIEIDNVDRDLDILAIKIDAKGNIQWNQTYGGITYQDVISKTFESNFVQSIIETSDGGYMLLGSIDYHLIVPDAGYGDISLLKIDKNGNKQWAKAYGGQDVEDAVSFVEASDGGYAIVGHKKWLSPLGKFDYDVLFFNVDSKGNAKKVEDAPTVTPIETPKEPKTIVVPDDYPTIFEAVENASGGDTIFVKKGIYDFGYDPLTIDKPLSLIGEDPKNTIIKSTYTSANYLITSFVTIDIEVPNVTVSGFTLTGGATAFRVGTEVYSPGSINIIGNNIENYGLRGFFIYSSNNVFVSENNFTDSNHGVKVSEVRNCTISGNNMTVKKTGIEISASIDVTVKENKVLESKQALDIGWGGPYQVYNNTITNNQEGIRFVRQCVDVSVYKNNIMYNDVGVVLENYNFQSRTVGSGAFYQNNCLENLQQVIFDPKLDENDTLRVDQADVISWNKNGKGNYWSDYTGADNNKNGIGDSPYVIDQNIQDKYPLMNPIDLSK